MKRLVDAFMDAPLWVMLVGNWFGGAVAFLMLLFSSGMNYAGAIILSIGMNMLGVACAVTGWQLGRRRS